MEVTSNCVVALIWTLKDTLGETLDVLDKPAEFLLGSEDLPPAVQQALQGKKAGSRLELHLEPENAFGDYDEQLVFLEPRSAFADDLEEGSIFDGHELPPMQSGEAPLHAIYTVTDIYPEHVVLDGNHPLAGIALRLSLQVTAVRAAGAGETQAGTAGNGFFRTHASVVGPSQSPGPDGQAGPGLH